MSVPFLDSSRTGLISDGKRDGARRDTGHTRSRSRKSIDPGMEIDRLGI